MGEPRADDALREALAMGCDAAYLLSDGALMDADISATTYTGSPGPIIRPLISMLPAITDPPFQGKGRPGRRPYSPRR